MMAAPRRLEPEWLDLLPAEDAEAEGSRRDLRRLNACMFHPALMACLLVRTVAGAPVRAIVDLGAGDGCFTLAVARRLAATWPGVTAILLDRKAIVGDETRRSFEAVGWRAEPVAADAFRFLETAPPGSADVVMANLFLHHFEPRSVQRLLAGASRLAPCFAACEPRRGLPALIASRLVGLIGCNRVTRHDAPASVRAGFREGELSALWPAAGRWRLTERAAGPLTHCFAARRAD
jgi:SAM-dependent methyltransferase